MDHHLEDSIHVASLAQVEKAADSFPPARPLGGVGGHIGVVFITELGNFPLLGVGTGLNTTGFVYEVVALAAIDRLLTDSEPMLGLCEVFVEESESAHSGTVEAHVLSEMRIDVGGCFRAEGLDFVRDIGIKVLTASVQRVHRKSHTDERVDICARQRGRRWVLLRLSQPERVA